MLPSILQGSIVNKIEKYLCTPMNPEEIMLFSAHLYNGFVVFFLDSVYICLERLEGKFQT